MTTIDESQKVGLQHRKRSAVVYLRQAVMPRPSEMGALVAQRNTLVGRALSLGWSREQVMVLDEDVGRSAHGHRPGFEHLLYEVRLGRVGMIVCTEPSRLARSIADWWSLVQACAAAGTLLCCLDRIDDAVSVADELRLLAPAITQ